MVALEEKEMMATRDDTPVAFPRSVAFCNLMKLARVRAKLPTN